MKRCLIALALTFAMLLSGCQLAKVDVSEQQGQERLIGVFVTEEHLDLFDFEAYFNDHAGDFVPGGEMVIESTEGYNQRIYANMENGGCEFEGLDGILFASYFFDDGIAKGYRNAPGNQVSGQITLEETESGTKLTMEGTIYVSDQIGYAQYFYNPVWQDPQGRVYLTAGTGLSSNVTEGGGMKNWHDICDEFEVTVNGTTQCYNANVRIGVEAIILPEVYTFCYMAENHRELGREVFKPESVPKEIHPPEGTAYILAEERSHRMDGTERIYRTICSSGQETVLDVFIPDKNHICVKGSTQILW